MKRVREDRDHEQFQEYLADVAEFEVFRRREEDAAQELEHQALQQEQEEAHKAEAQALEQQALEQAAQPREAAVPDPRALDEELRVPGGSTSSKFYMFTVVRGGDVTWRQPETVGKAGLWDAIVFAYASVFPERHPCHAGPIYGKVVLERHANGDAHLHAACAFPQRHRWKAVELHLREQQKVKAGLAHFWLN